MRLYLRLSCCWRHFNVAVGSRLSFTSLHSCTHACFLLPPHPTCVCKSAQYASRMLAVILSCCLNFVFTALHPHLQRLPSVRDTPVCVRPSLACCNAPPFFPSLGMHFVTANP